MAETGVIPEGEGDPNRRDFIHIAAGAAAVGAATPQVLVHYLYVASSAVFSLVRLLS